MDDECPECGASVPPTGTCRDNFDALQAIEWSFPDGVGETVHYRAVSAYILQHPKSMGYSREAFAALRTALSDNLHNGVPMSDCRHRMRRKFDGETRVQRQPCDPLPRSQTTSWPVTVTDLVSATLDAEVYADYATQWAASVLETLRL